jgi:capsular polysaccharide transport system ATP-binding protein
MPCATAAEARMIVLRNLTKTFYMHGARKTVADNLNVTFPTGVAVGLLGRNGAGKSTLLKIIAGTASPTAGEVLSDGRISFPVGLATSLHPDMSGAQNTRFVARIYGVDTDALAGFVEEFAELGDHFHLPVRSYSSGMKGRLSFGINMGLKFDTYLIDEVTAVGDAAFRSKSEAVFQDRLREAGAIFVSHALGPLKRICQAGAVLEGGHLSYYDDIEEAIAHHERNMSGSVADDD